VADARATREAIIERAVQLSSVHGLDGITIGRLAGDLHMSKAGVLGHFGSKEALQLTALEAAFDVMQHEVWDRAAEAEPGLPRLLALCDAWTDYLERGVFPGGCFMTAASCEFDDREGPVREALAKRLSRWYSTLEEEARTAVEAGDLPADTEPPTIALQLNALAMAANQRRQLLGDRSAPAVARRAMRAALGVDDR
jgi:AcrR family transcriptional regulator